MESLKLFKEHYKQMQLNHCNKLLLVDKMFSMNAAWFLQFGFTNYNKL